jgi:DnaK suppressor protein
MKPQISSELKLLLLKRKNELLLNTQQGMREMLTGEVRQGIGSGREEGDFASINHLEYLSSQRFNYQHRLIRQIDAAIARIDDGTFGTCTECGEEIGMKRLAVLPFVILCHECQEQKERCLVHC